jgi:hypothetical protein
MTAHHVVYVIELCPHILADDPVFAAANPNYKPGYDCLYVGLTGLSREQRLENHRKGDRACRRVQPYLRDLRPDLWVGFEGPYPWPQVEDFEKILAFMLRARGYAVWQN